MVYYGNNMIFSMIYVLNKIYKHQKNLNKISMINTIVGTYTIDWYIYISDPFNLKEFTEFNEIEDKLITPVEHIEMAWKPNYDVVAIGNSNGYFCIINIIFIIILFLHIFVLL